MAAAAINQPVLLSAVLQGIYPLHARSDRPLQDITLDSRRVQSGSLFMAYKGASHDGRQFIDRAIAAGAAAVLVEADEVDWCCEQVVWLVRWVMDWWAASLRATSQAQVLRPMQWRFSRFSPVCGTVTPIPW
jgi:UDP-N-acetylmuramyl pentapeptide synthase